MHILDAACDTGARLDRAWAWCAQTVIMKPHKMLQLFVQSGLGVTLRMELRGDALRAVCTDFDFLFVCILLHKILLSKESCVSPSISGCGHLCVYCSSILVLNVVRCPSPVVGEEIRFYHCRRSEHLSVFHVQLHTPVHIWRSTSCAVRTPSRQSPRSRDFGECRHGAEVRLCAVRARIRLHRLIGVLQLDPLHRREGQ